MAAAHNTAEGRDSASGGYGTTMSTEQHNQIYATTRYTLRARAVHVSYIVGSPPATLLFEKNWSLNHRHVESGSNLTEEGPSRGTVTRGRHGMAIASFSTRLPIALGVRVRRLDRRLSATFKRLIQSELRLLITWLTHVWSYNPISAVASVTASADCHACWTTGERASGTPGTPVATLSADTTGRLQRFSAGIFTGFCLTSDLDYHVCWITGERASDTPGPSAATRTSDTAGRLQRFSACYFIGARRTSDLERQACSNFTATCPAFYLERNACWTTGERASATPGSPVASLFSDTLGRPQHPLDCCFFSACRMFYWDRSACWTTGGRASDTPGSPVASLSPGTLGRPQRFLNCTSAYPQHDCCIVGSRGGVYIATAVCHTAHLLRDGHFLPSRGTLAAHNG